MASDTDVARWYEKDRMSGHVAGGLNRRADISIRTASTNISAHGLAHRSVVSANGLVSQANRRHDLTSRAIAALIRVVLEERSLHGVQFAVRPLQAFDGDELIAVVRD